MIKNTIHVEGAFTSKYNQLMSGEDIRQEISNIVMIAAHLALLVIDENIRRASLFGSIAAID
jgi:hypothetical protein